MKKVQKQLFIGGCLDGQRLAVPSELDVFEANPRNYGKEITDREFYCRTRIAARNCIFVFWRLETMTEDTAVERLLEGYKRSD